MDICKFLAEKGKNHPSIVMFFAPFCTCLSHLSNFFIWFAFVIVAGQMGTIINVIRRHFFYDWNLKASLCPDSSSGNFYTFALVLIASLLGPLFTKFINGEKPEFRKVKALFITILIFTLLLCATFFSFATQNTCFIDYEALYPKNIVIDIPQFIFFILSIIFACYAYGLTLIVEFNHTEFFSCDDEYAKKENQKVEKISNQIDDIPNQIGGIKL